MTCPVCGAELPKAGGPTTIVTCPECGTGVTAPPPARDVGSDGLFEEGSYAGTRLQRREQWMKEAATRMDWVERLLSPGRLLELGCATGELLEVAADRGWQTHGVETSGWAARTAADLAPGAEIHHGDLAGWQRRHHDITVDVVALFHVLEHVHQPAELLTEVRAVVRPGGLVFIEVPNWASAAARRDRAGWHMALVDDHVVHFTPASLERLVEQTGLEVVERTEETWRLYDPPAAWLRRRVKDLVRGRLAPARDLLRIVARRPEADAG